MAKAIKDETLLSAQSASGTTAYVTAPLESERFTFYIESGAGVSAGAVTIEEAHDRAYAGTWAAVGSAVTVPAASTVSATHITANAYGALRVRISTGVEGGTINVRVVSN